MTTLIWLRNDLRLADNPALDYAAHSGPQAVYVFCREYVERHDMAPVRLDFIRRQLHSLAPALYERGIPVTLVSVERARDIPGALLALADEKGADELVFNAEYPLDERHRDTAVAAAFRERGLGIKRFHDRVLIRPGQVRNGQGQPYKVFTAFKKRWRSLLGDAPPVPGGLPPAGDPLEPPAALRARIDGLFADCPQGDLSALWPAGEDAAHARLKSFVERELAHYHQRRDFPALTGTSQLSPYLATGIVSPRQCLAAALSAAGGDWDGQDGAATWISELIWREFYQHLVVDFPHVCQHKPFQPHTEAIPWRGEGELFRAWCEARTGIPLVDAAMTQLNETGWMHNRLRMVTAMFLTKNLRVDWRLGERWFMRHLIDGDFAANNGGWQWSASTGTDAAPYFRIFNPVTQSERFDPNGDFIRQYLPQLAHLDNKRIHRPPNTPGYPEPVIDLGQSRRETIELFRNLATQGAQHASG